jgi:hypothetical protein
MNMSELFVLILPRADKRKSTVEKIDGFVRADL